MELLSSACITPVVFAINPAMSNAKCSGKLLYNYYKAIGENTSGLQLVCRLKPTGVILILVSEGKV